MGTARSIHIGLNNVDPDCYNGWDGALSGCINDANDMQAIADGLGYQSTLLTDSSATADRVIAEIGQTAADLKSGDILLLTYSGHGGQVDDVNGDEDDALDETWVLWDRQLIDDELFALWGKFAPGVRIIVLSDSCHSGTVSRVLAAARELSREIGGARPSPDQAALLAALNKAAQVDAPANGSARQVKRAVPNGSRSAPGPLGAKRAVATSYGVPKRIPGDIQDLVNKTREVTHAAAQWLAGDAEKADVGASVILISGCQDNQLSMDGNANGLFTEKVKQAWDGGNFTGNYRAFWTSVKALMPQKQQPNYSVVGAPNAAFEGQSPFEIGSSDDGYVTPQPAQPQNPPAQPQNHAAQPPAAPAATNGSRPILRQGSSGPDVRYLQTRLDDQEYNIAVDGLFGPMTTSAVRSFQNASGLDADGVVGPLTWQALG